LSVFFTDRLDRVGIAPFAFCATKPCGEPIHIEGFGLLTTSASGTIIFGPIAARHT
jgi:hypothetical protein